MTMAPPTETTTAVSLVPSSIPRFSDEELAEINAGFEGAPASKIIRWAVDTFHPYLCMTASMSDAVLIDLAHKGVYAFVTGYIADALIEGPPGVPAPRRPWLER